MESWRAVCRMVAECRQRIEFNHIVRLTTRNFFDVEIGTYWTRISGLASKVEADGLPIEYLLDAHGFPLPIVCWNGEAQDKDR
jgi:hypothetical protein